MSGGHKNVSLQKEQEIPEILEKGSWVLLTIKDSPFKLAFYADLVLQVPEDDGTIDWSNKRLTTPDRVDWTAFAEEFLDTGMCIEHAEVFEGWCYWGPHPVWFGFECWYPAASWKEGVEILCAQLGLHDADELVNDDV